MVYTHICSDCIESNLPTERKKTVIAIVGPTCTGKTALSLALADRVAVKVVSCDSRNVYKYMDIGTAKPSVEEQSRVKHYLIDVAEPNEVFTVAQYKKLGAQVIADTHSHDELPVVCGGTGLYARALLEGLVIPEVAPQADLRQELREFALQHGNEALHRRLHEIDPLTANRLNPNDLFRVIRAMEVSLITGKPFSRLTEREPHPYHTIWIGLTVNNRELLKRDISLRFDEQMEAGLLREVEALLARYGPTQTLRKAVTYAELIEYLEGKISLEQARENCLRHNYQLARRQLMWFKANENMNWFAVDEIDRANLIDGVMERLKMAQEAEF